MRTTSLTLNRHAIVDMALLLGFGSAKTLNPNARGEIRSLTVGRIRRPYSLRWTATPPVEGVRYVR